MSCNGAHIRLEVAAAGANGMRNACTQIMDLSRHGLGSSPRSANDANGPAANAIRKPQPDTVYDRRPTIGSHDQESFFARSFLQSNFIFEQDVVAVEKNVFIEIKRFTRHTRRVATRN